MSTYPTFTDEERFEILMLARGMTDFGDLPEETNSKIQEYFYVPGEHGSMPYGTMKARTGDPYEWCSLKLTEMLEAGQLHKFLGIENATKPNTPQAVQPKRSSSAS